MIPLIFTEYCLLYLKNDLDEYKKHVGYISMYDLSVLTVISVSLD